MLKLLFTLDGAVIGETYLLYAGDVADDRVSPRPVRPGAGLVPGGGGRHAGDGLLPLDL
ncbi:hypothetical protein M5E87_22655 [Flavonifractor plautii]|nr:hypothetical protein M5E87_22655 [Flavonifractor plautii]